MILSYLCQHNYILYKQRFKQVKRIIIYRMSMYHTSAHQYTQPIVRQVLKFNFSDYHLAHRIHAFIKQRLIKFDINNNGKFQQKQIKNALVQILGENQEEIQYVVNNVFRYDTDADGAVTYQQFIKFCVEQHFGELSIQRLHKRNVYQNANQRILNKKQFIQTLEYGFANLRYDVDNTQLQQLFFQIDTDRDGYISYQDYFTFLRQYFSNKRIDPVNADRQPIVNDDSYIKNLSRIVKLVFPQIRSLIIEQDMRREMKLNNVQIRDFISNNFKYCTHNPSKTFVGDLPEFPALKNQVNYEQALKIVIEAVFNPNINNKGYANTINLINSNRPLSNEQFVQKFFQNQLGAIRVRPARYMMDQIYDHLTRITKQQGLSQKDYVNFLRDIAQIYQPDYRVLI